MVDARAVSAPPSPPPIVEMRVRRSNKMKISKNENHYFYLLSAPRQPGGEAESAPRPAAAAQAAAAAAAVPREQCRRPCRRLVLHRQDQVYIPLLKTCNSGSAVSRAIGQRESPFFSWLEPSQGYNYEKPDSGPESGKPTPVRENSSPCSPSPVVVLL